MWYQLRIGSCQSQEVEGLSLLLEESGALSLSLRDQHDEPVLEPEPGTTPLWPEVVIEALYSGEQKQAVNKAKEILAQIYPHLAFTVETVVDQEWQRACIEEFKPQCFGNRLWVCPSWHKPPDPQATNLILDPGLAFGTGTHPTTALCLAWLAQADLQAKAVIDYGCGSGILALAASKLGASHVQAVDIDPQALQATQTNALGNCVGAKQLTISSPEVLSAPVDLILANILLTPLLALQSRFRELLKEGGKLVLSGILTEQTNTVISAYTVGFNYQSTNNLHGWSILVFNAL